MVVESLAARDLVIAVVQRRALTGYQNAQALLPLLKRQRVDGFAIEVEEIEQEKDESTAVTGLEQRFEESRVDLMAYGRTPWS